MTGRDGKDLAFMIRCPGHKPVTLRPGDRVRFGRHTDNDLVLNHRTVSRFHGVIAWDADEDRPFVEDNDSANGIELDGEPIDRKAYLTGDDNQLEVGDFMLALRPKGAPLKPQAAVVKDGDTGALRLFSEGEVDIRGKFEGPFELHRVLLDLEEQQRTGTLMVQVGVRNASLTFARGLVVTASWADGLEGMPALREVLVATRGTYRFGSEVQPSEQNLGFSPRGFLEEGGGETMRMRKDELK